MTPVERAARALGSRNFPNMANGWIDRHWPEFVGDVHVVLHAIREPSGRMVDAGCGIAASPGLTTTRNQWRTMIDAALAEGYMDAAPSISRESLSRDGEAMLPDRSDAAGAIGPAG